jgi:uncharacterized membrane protein YfcA
MLRAMSRAAAEGEKGEGGERRPMTTLLIGLGIGLAAGVLSGMFGIGGGILIVPALVFLGLEQKTATGTSLAALLMPVGILGVFEYSKRHQIRVHYAVGLALGLLVGAYFGARIVGTVSSAALRKGFGVLLVTAAVRFLFF